MMFGAMLPGVEHLLGGGVLLLSFVLVLRRRAVAAINSLAAQGVLLALMALCHAWARDSAAMGLTALLLLAGQGVLLPLALREWVRRMGLRQEAPTAPAGRPLPALLAAVALVLLSVLAVLPVTMGAAAAMREDLVLSLSVILIGLLLMAARRGPPAGSLGQAVGLSSLTNGALLAVLAAPGLSGTGLSGTGLSTTGLPLLPAVAVVAMLVPFGTVAAFLTLRPQAGPESEEDAA
jgi:hydrogenase-4 component E